MEVKLKDILKQLKTLGYTYILSKSDNYTEAKELKDAVYVRIGHYNENENCRYIGKDIKIPKREKNLNLAYFIDKIEKENIYKTFAKDFEKLLKSKGISNNLNIYPTTYGIGVYIVIGSKKTYR